MLNYLNAWSENIWSIIFWRSLIAVPLASFVVVVTGIITDIFREKERAFWLVREIFDRALIQEWY